MITDGIDPALEAHIQTFVTGAELVAVLGFHLVWNGFLRKGCARKRVFLRLSAIKARILKCGMALSYLLKANRLTLLHIKRGLGGASVASVISCIDNKAVGAGIEAC